MKRKSKDAPTGMRGQQLPERHSRWIGRETGPDVVQSFELELPDGSCLRLVREDDLAASELN